jgi:hypothetical protein
MTTLGCENEGRLAPLGGDKVDVGRILKGINNSWA